MSLQLLINGHLMIKIYYLCIYYYVIINCLNRYRTVQCLSFEIKLYIFYITGILNIITKNLINILNLIQYFFNLIGKLKVSDA